MTTTLSLIAVFFLLAANAFFVAAEFALVKARPFRLTEAADGGSRSAKKTLAIQGKIEPYLASCQLGITMASLGLGWVGEPTVAAIVEPWLSPLGFSEAAVHSIAFLIGFIIFSSLHIVVGEQVPKTMAIRKAEPMSMLIAYPLGAFYILSYPLTWVLNAGSQSILRWFGIEEATHGEVLSDREIRGIVETSAAHGELEEETAVIIDNLFKLDERAVERVMIPRVECAVLRTDMDQNKLTETMISTQHSRFPLVADGQDELVGVILMKDLVNLMLTGTDPDWQDLAQYAREPLVVPETMRVQVLFEIMRTNRAHMACVIDEYGAFVGLVTMEDLLEELVGDISDETDQPSSEAVVQKVEGGWVADGLASLADVEREIGLEIDDRFNANTLSGLFMTRLQRIPVEGDEVVENGFRLVASKTTNRRVTIVQIELVTPSTLDDKMV